MKKTSKPVASKAGLVHGQVDERADSLREVNRMVTQIARNLHCAADALCSMQPEISKVISFLERDVKPVAGSALSQRED